MWYTKGPYCDSEGKPLKFMVKSTPVPLEFADPVMLPVIKEPVALSKFVDGRTAMYVAAGLLFWIEALPPGPGDWKISLRLNGKGNTTACIEMH